MSYPFTQPAANTHSGFSPMKLSNVMVPNSSGDPGRPSKPPKAPEKPLMPYMRYSRKMWDKVRAQNTDSKLWDIGKIIGQMWRELPDSQKQIYSEEYEIEKSEYEKAMKQYHNSPAYQTYLQHKTTNTTSNEKGSKQKSAPQTDIGVYIQPVEEEDGSDGQLSVKHIAATRFQRNHRLIAEIFSRAVIPDLRTVVTSSRMNILKRQVQSLTMHQQKLESELQGLEDKFEAKKRKIQESSQEFLKKYDEISEQKPVIDEEFMKRAVEVQMERLKTAFAAHQKAQQETRAKLEAAQQEPQVFAVPTVPTPPVAVTEKDSTIEAILEEKQSDDKVVEKVDESIAEPKSPEKARQIEKAAEPSGVVAAAEEAEAEEPMEKSEEEDNNDDDDESFEMSTDADDESKDGY